MASHKNHGIIIYLFFKNQVFYTKKILKKRSIFLPKSKRAPRSGEAEKQYFLKIFLTNQADVFALAGNG